MSGIIKDSKNTLVVNLKFLITTSLVKVLHVIVSITVKTNK